MRNLVRIRQLFYVFLALVFVALAGRAQTFTTLDSFDTSTGRLPFGNLVQTKTGSFLGTTQSSGAHGRGTVFEVTSAGSLVTLHSFDDADGSSPEAGLVLGANGNYYGTTSLGGSHSNGAVFEINSGGAVTTLHSFSRNKDGAGPVAPLAKGKDGNFYGTSSQGGPHGGGTVFKITPGGTLTTLYGFCDKQSGSICVDGEFPLGGLVQASNGNFYGTTDLGGLNDAGTIFEITTGGKLTVLHSFAGAGADADGRQPSAGLLLAGNGKLYGTTPAGGSHNLGTVFEITSGGSFTTVHNFAGSDGSSAAGDLIQARNGVIYGVTTVGGANGAGTIFALTLANKLTTVYSFSSQHNGGTEPLGGLVQGKDGDLYGTTTVHGQFRDGTVFKFSLSE